MFVVPPQIQPHAHRTPREIAHDSFCGVLLGLIVGVAGWFISGNLYYFLAAPIVTLLSVVIGLLMGAGTNRRFRTPVIW